MPFLKFLLFILQKFRSAHTAAKPESGIEILSKQEAKVSFQSNNLMFIMPYHFIYALHK